MKEFKYVITDPEGIHARPAGVIVRGASEFKSKVTITKDGKEMDAKRILGIMGLAAKKGDEITIKIDGVDEDAALTSLQTVFKENL